MRAVGQLGHASREPFRCTWAVVLTERPARGSDLHQRLRLDLGHRPGPVARYGGGAMDRATVALLGRGLNERLDERLTLGRDERPGET